MPANIPQENIFGVTIPPAHSVGDIIDGALAQKTTTLQFPSDRPKYFTQLAFETYTFRTGTGGTPQLPGATGIGVGAGGLAGAAIGGATGGFAGLVAGGLLGAVAGGTISQALQDQYNAPGADKAGMDSWANQILTEINAGQASATTPQATGDLVLPLPVNLVDVHKVKYDEKPILAWVSALGNFLGVGTNPLSIAGALYGLAPNYYHTILFDRPEYKRHELTFKLAARNFAEAMEIRDIIIFLNNRMAPGVTGGAVSAIFTFPDIVRVTLKPNAGYLFKFKPAVIEDFAINYSGGGGKKAFFHDPVGFGGGTGNNPPESVEFTLHLLEIEYWLKGQFNAADAP